MFYYLITYTTAFTVMLSIKPPTYHSLPIRHTTDHFWAICNLSVYYYKFNQCAIQWKTTRRELPGKRHLSRISMDENNIPGVSELPCKYHTALDP